MAVVPFVTTQPYSIRVLQALLKIHKLQIPQKSDTVNFNRSLFCS